MDCQPYYTTSRDAYHGPSGDRSASASYSLNNSGRVASPESKTTAPGAAKSPLLCTAIATQEVNVATWGYARARVNEFESLRKRLPAWAPADAPDHFFRHSDEQTILAAWAVDDALRRAGMQASEVAQWGIIAASEFLGRQHVAVVLEKFARNGSARVSPNSIVQHSLHSVSGTLSILLASRGPNLGVGGGRRSLTEGLFAALTLFDLQSAAGCWLVATTWDPLPLPDEQGNCRSEATCHAVALGLKSRGASSRGRLSLKNESSGELAAEPDVSVTSLIETLEQLERSRNPRQIECRLAWGPTLSLEVRNGVASARRAA